jgi:hypothetical protein
MFDPEKKNKFEILCSYGVEMMMVFWVVMPCGFLDTVDSDVSE